MTPAREQRLRVLGGAEPSRLSVGACSPTQAGVQLTYPDGSRARGSRAYVNGVVEVHADRGYLEVVTYADVELDP